MKHTLHALPSIVCLVLMLLFISCQKDEVDPDPTDKNTTTALTGKIVYESVGKGIYEYDTQTGQTRSIIQDGFQPQRTTDGKTFHIVGRNSGGSFFETKKLALMSADNLNRTPLFELGDWESFYDPKLSPSGNHVAFSYVKGAFGELHDGSGTVIVNKDGTFFAAFDSTNYPTWMPDGRLVVDGTYRYGSWGSTVEGTKKRPGIYISNPSFTQLTLLTTAINGPIPKMPAVNPTGDKIAFIMNQDLWVMNIDGSNMKALTNSIVQLEFPTWSPDGKHLAVIGGQPRPPYTGRANAIAVIPANLSTPVDLNDDSPNYIRTKEGNVLNATKQFSWK